MLLSTPGGAEADPKPNPVSAPDKSSGYPGIFAPGPVGGGGGGLRLRFGLGLPIRPLIEGLGNSQSAVRGMCHTFGTGRAPVVVVSYMSLSVGAAGVAFNDG